MKPLVVVGDALLDRDLAGDATRLCPDAPAPVVEDPTTSSRPGGAGLAAVLAAREGRPVVLVTALGADAAGEELAGLLAERGVALVDLGSTGRTPEKVRVLAGGHPVVRLDHGTVPGEPGPWSEAAAGALGDAAAVLVADYGRGITASPGVRAALRALPQRVPVVWDPHPRGGAPVAGARLVTPNAAEAAAAAPGVGSPGPAGLAGHTARGRALLQRWQAATVAITLGARGAVLVAGDEPPLVVPAMPAGGDPCGAGDCFAAVAASRLGEGALPSEAVTDAVAAAGRYVAAGGPAGLLALDAVGAGGAAGAWDAAAVVAATRARGGTVVATGGCFDLLHAGHVTMLQAARALGDCLVVCLNSDASVRRLKGADRPIVPQDDRARVLAGLACVDAVAVFDEDTPLAVLDRLRPDVFAKGADYTAAELPEAALLASWGGQAVVVPFLEGRSSSHLVQEVVHRHAR